MQLDVGGVACIVTSERKSFLWNVEQLAPSAKLGLHVFLQVLSGENVTTFGAGWVAVGDTLEVGHWMLFGFARLQDSRWGDFSSISGSAVFHDLLRFAVDCDFDNIVVDVAGGGITMKTAPLYRKYRGHVVVVLDPWRRSGNLTRRCTRAKLHETKRDLQDILARLENDPDQFWWEQAILWPGPCSRPTTELDWDIPKQVRNRRIPSDFATSRARTTVVATSGS